MTTKASVSLLDDDMNIITTIDADDAKIKIIHPESKRQDFWTD